VVLIVMMLGSITSTIEPPLHPVAFAIEPLLDAVALLVEMFLDTIALFVEPVGPRFVAVSPGGGGSSIQPVVDALAAFIQTIIDAVTLLIEAIVDAFAALIHALVDPISTIIGHGGSTSSNGRQQRQSRRNVSSAIHIQSPVELSERWFRKL
jgi:hypothetical protein